MSAFGRIAGHLLGAAAAIGLPLPVGSKYCHLLYSGALAFYSVPECWGCHWACTLSPPCLQQVQTCAAGCPVCESCSWFGNSETLLGTITVSTDLGPRGIGPLNIRLCDPVSTIPHCAIVATHCLSSVQGLVDYGEPLPWHGCALSFRCTASCPARTICCCPFSKQDAACAWQIAPGICTDYPFQALPPRSFPSCFLHCLWSLPWAATPCHDRPPLCSPLLQNITVASCTTPRLACRLLPPSPSTVPCPGAAVRAHFCPADRAQLPQEQPPSWTLFPGVRDHYCPGDRALVLQEQPPSWTLFPGVRAHFCPGDRAQVPQEQPPSWTLFPGVRNHYCPGDRAQVLQEQPPSCSQASGLNFAPVTALRCRKNSHLPCICAPVTGICLAMSSHSAVHLPLAGGLQLQTITRLGRRPNKGVLPGCDNPAYGFVLFSHCTPGGRFPGTWASRVGEAKNPGPLRQTNLGSYFSAVPQHLPRDLPAASAASAPTRPGPTAQQDLRNFFPANPGPLQAQGAVHFCQSRPRRAPVRNTADGRGLGGRETVRLLCHCSGESHQHSPQNPHSPGNCSRCHLPL